MEFMEQQKMNLLSSHSLGGIVTRYNKILLKLFLLLLIISQTAYSQNAIRSGYTQNKLARIDDDNFKRSPIGFEINFFDVLYTQLFVNDNGNVTFDKGLPNYVPWQITGGTQPMLAPFFADVETEFDGEQITYGTGNVDGLTSFGVNWVGVSYFTGSDKTGAADAISNSFQLILIDRSDVAAGDFDIEFNYTNIEWESGAASDNGNYPDFDNKTGLGGVPASMGWTNGAGAFYSHEGSLVNSAFINGGPNSLPENSLNSDVNGRYVFQVRNGVIVIPNLISAQSFSIPETATEGYVAGQVVSNSADSLSINYSFETTPPEFVINPTNGSITVSPTAVFDYQTQSVYNLSVIASNVNDPAESDTATITITIIEVDFFANHEFTIPETSSVGETVGLLSNQMGALVPVSYTLVDPNPDFVVNANNGHITVSPTGTFEFDNQTLYNFQVVATNLNNPLLTDTATVTVNITEVPLVWVDGFINAFPGDTTFLTELNISLSSNGEQIYFTTDGSLPDTNNPAQLYTDAFTINATQGNLITVQAIAVGNLINPILHDWSYSQQPLVTHAWMVDANIDGRADIVYATFNTPLAAAPSGASISWAALPQGDMVAPVAGQSTISLLPGNSSAIAIEFIGEGQFPFALTGFGEVIPQLTLSDGQTIPVADSIKPIITQATKYPSNFANYVLQGNESVILTLPDTLVVTLSEPLIPDPAYTAGAHFEAYLLKLVTDQQLLATLKAEPVPLNSARTEWQLLIENDPTLPNTIKIGDMVSLNPTGPYRDIATNTPNLYAVPVQGTDGQVDVVAIDWREEIVGQYELDAILQSSSVSGPGTSIPVHDANGVEVSTVPAQIQPQWVQSQTVGPNGTVINTQTVCPDGPGPETTARVDFPKNCLSSLAVLSDKNQGAYTAEIQILDHLGKFVHGSIQYFGNCGELNNPERITTSGLILNDLFWNQQDSEGNRVGSGVYIWNVKLTFANGTTEVIKKMGIARRDAFSYETCLSRL